MAKIDINLYPKKILDQLKRCTTTRNQRIYPHLPKFIFLCGKHITEGKNRKLIKTFFKTIGRNEVFCFYAEDLFDSNKRKELDLLTFEDYLAELSDGIILFVESYGTACELGAFAMKDNLIPKMLVINDKKHKASESFISDGPIKKIIATYPNNVIHTDIDAIFSNHNLHNQLKNFINKKTCKINKKENEVKLNSFVIELLEMIYLFGPVISKELFYIYNYIKGFTRFSFISEFTGGEINIKLNYIVEFLHKSNLISINNGYIDINSDIYKPTGFMFNLSYKQFMDYRLRILSRKYHYEGKMKKCL